MDDADRAHRGAAADRLELGDEVDRGDLRRAGDRAAGKRRLEDLRQPDSVPQLPSTVETMCSTPASSRVAMSSGQRTVPGLHTRERSFRSRSTIITCSAASFSDPRSSAAAPRGRVPLIGIVHTRSPRRARKSSGDAETTAQASVTNGRAEGGGAERAERRAHRVPGERRAEVLDEVHLVHVAARDGGRTSSIAAPYSPAVHVRSQSPMRASQRRGGGGSPSRSLHAASGSAGQGSGGGGEASRRIACESP